MRLIKLLHSISSSLLTRLRCFVFSEVMPFNVSTEGQNQEDEKCRHDCL